jgi:uncharacterized membrane protein YhiD involved in acid resistance
LKLSEEHLIHGLTVSVRIWTTAAVGIAIGLGKVGIVLIPALPTVSVLLVRAPTARWRALKPNGREPREGRILLAVMGRQLA